MKIKSTIVFLFFICVLSNLSAERRAFLVGIGEYPKELGWKKISGDIDIKYIQSALEKNYFSASEIVILRNHKATKMNIIKGLEDFITDCELGDVVYIQLSGHGQQICDVSGDEIDLLDEAFVPYDSPLKDSDGTNLLLDDEIEILLTNLRNKLGVNGQVIFVLDACHSASGIRSSRPYRGGVSPINKRDCSGGQEELHYNLSTGHQIYSDQLSSISAFYACKPNELNYEYYDVHNDLFVGSFTYALSECLMKYKGLTNIRDFTLRLRSRMAVYSKTQTPTFEGNMDGALFNNSDSKFSFLIPASIIDNQMICDIGTISGVHDGSLFHVFNAISNEFICQGISSKSSLANSVLIPINFNVNELREVPIYVELKQKAPPNISLKIQKELKENSRWDEIISKLQKKGIAEIFAKASFKIEEIENSTLLIKSLNDEIISEVPFESIEESMMRLEDQFHLVNQINFLRNLETNHPKVKLEVHLIKSKSHKVPNKVSNFDKVKIGEKVDIKISNIGLVGCYFYLINISSNNQINIISIKKASYVDQFLNKGESIVLGKETKLTIGGPVGIEMLKIIGSENPIDVESLLRFGQLRGDECPNINNDFCLNYFYEVID